MTPMSSSAARITDEVTLSNHVEALAELGAPFDALLRRNGPPPLWRRPATFGTLVRLILEQQVSLASANAAYRRLEVRVGEVTPEAILASTPQELRVDGFSRQKDRYVRGIASAVLSMSFVLPEPDDEVGDARDRLLAMTGIGPWTAACYLVFVIGAPDVWPRGDRALHVAMATALGCADAPDSDEAEQIASGWAPYRSTAARMLWHHYLGGRDYVQAPDSGFL